jgi:hypothetical protein
MILKPCMVTPPKGTQSDSKPYTANEQGLRYTITTQLAIEVVGVLHKMVIYTYGAYITFCPLPPITQETQQAPMLQVTTFLMPKILWGSCTRVMNNIPG